MIEFAVQASDINSFFRIVARIFFFSSSSEFSNTYRFQSTSQRFFSPSLLHTNPTPDSICLAHLVTLHPSMSYPWNYWSEHVTPAPAEIPMKTDSVSGNVEEWGHCSLRQVAGKLPWLVFSFLYFPFWCCSSLTLTWHSWQECGAALSEVSL